MLRILLVGACLLVPACASEIPSPVGAGKLRPGIVTVYEGEKTTSACTSESVDQCPTYENVIVSDVDVDGDRIAVLRMRQLQFVRLTVSEDQGVTWRSYALDKALATDIVWDGFNVGVYLTGGQTFLVLSRDFSPLHPEWVFFPVTLQADGAMVLGKELTFSSALLHPMTFFEKRANGHLRGLVTLGNEVPVIYDLDPLTREVVADELPCTGLACTVDFAASSDRGDTFEAFSQGGAPGTGVCRLHWSEAAGASQACVSDTSWFLPIYSHHTHLMMRGAEPYVAWSQAGQAYAVSVTREATPRVTPVLALGPGTIENYQISRLNRHRFGDFEYVETKPGEGRLVRLTADGPEEVHFRDTPCDGAGCGYERVPNFGLSLMQWAQPTGRGDYYVFYTVQTASAGNQQKLFMSRSERPTFTPILASGPLPGPEVFVPPANAAPMNPLQTACIAWSACGPGDFNTCLSRWTTTTADLPYMAVARARFIAAAAVGCAALADVWPGTSACGSECLRTGGDCTPGVTSCTNLVPVSASSCGSCQNAGTYLECSSTMQVYATTCPAGTTCSAGSGCVLSAGCTGSRCMGTNFVDCDGVTAAPTTTDCAGRGGTCDAQRSGCVSTQVGETCAPASYVVQCEGPFIKGCGLGNVSFTDCRALGYETCIGGRCT